MALGDGVVVAPSRALGPCLPGPGLPCGLGAASLSAFDLLVGAPHFRRLEGVHHDGHDVLAARQQRAGDCKRDEAHYECKHVARHVLCDGVCDERVDRRGEHVAQCEAALPQAEQEHR